MLASVVSFHTRKLLVQNCAFIVDGDPFVCKQASRITAPPFALPPLPTRFSQILCFFCLFCSFLGALSWPSSKWRGEKTTPRPAAWHPQGVPLHFAMPHPSP